MGQDQSRSVSCGTLQREPQREVRDVKEKETRDANEAKGNVTAMRIKKQLEEGKIKPEIPGRKNIQIQPPQESIRQEPQRLPPMRRQKSSDKPPVRPRSAKPPIATQPKPQIQHQNIIRLSKQPFQQSIRTQNGFLEVAQMSLSHLIESRHNTKKYFPQDNVVSLLESLAYAMAALQVKQIRHHDIYPTNIFFVNGIFKLTNPILTKQSSYALTLQRKRFSFLSPQLILYLREEIEDVKEDVLYRADMFSLGMIMLQFCSLKPSSECYDQDNYEILDSVVKARLSEIAKLYNPKIAEGIDLLLKYELQQRMTAFAFAKILSQTVHQFQTDLSNSKKSQLIIQGQHSPQVSSVGVQNHQPKPQGQSSVVAQQSQSQYQYQPQTQTQIYPQTQYQHQSQPQPQQHFQFQPQIPPTPLPLGALQYGTQPLKQLSQTQNTPSTQLLSSPHPVSSPVHQAQSPIPPVSYPYIQSPITPINQPQYSNYLAGAGTSSYSSPVRTDYASQPSSTTDGSSSRYASNTPNYYSPSYTVGFNSSKGGVPATLSELEYQAPTYSKDDYMKPERDTPYRDAGLTRDYKLDFQQNYHKNYDDTSSAYTRPLSPFGGRPETSESPVPSFKKAEEPQSLEQRVRRILERSKQIK